MKERRHFHDLAYAHPVAANGTPEHRAKNENNINSFARNAASAALRKRPVGDKNEDMNRAKSRKMEKQ